MVTTLAVLPNQTRCVSAAHELTHQEDCVASPAERHDLTSNSFRLIWNTSLPDKPEYFPKGLPSGKDHLRIVP